MRSLLFLFLLTAFFTLCVSAQVPLSRLERLLHFVGEDSVVLSYNEQYLLVEDSCAALVRYARFDQQLRKFTGPFRDVRKTNPEQVVATGSYNSYGGREGVFSCYYPDGTLQAKGRFDNHRLAGRWDFFYPTGDPKLTFFAGDSDVKIISTWDENGKKRVDNGYGNYEARVGPIVWKGLLVGGQPDGKWIAQRLYHTEEELASERFKLGVFQKGKNQAGEYRDGSHILLVSAEDLLPFTKAEGLWVSNEACGATPKKIIVYAHYAKGAQAFGEEIKEHLVPVLNRMKLTSFNEPIEIKGRVLTDGRIVFESSDAVTSALKTGLLGLPSLEPAWIDNKKVEQEIVIQITYNSSVYSFRYRLLPVKTE